MLVAIGVLAGALIVSGQALWASVLRDTGREFRFEASYLFSSKFGGLLLEPRLLAGLGSYGLATLLYFYLLSRYPFAAAQVTVIGASLVFNALIAAAVFNQPITGTTALGFLLVAAGVWLVVYT